uniref:Uncharacterized protein n=1 Tax=Candidatus Kentrum sp. TUN TaxID=2126343 RepID=A0A450ZN24_9GAMM|nr:MAG: hypothetical protein BECKTUN1418F_GA0071002_10254 [Candidatus Kentron sp. TUN]VFK54263.1 MAG: hypothetical protein BECKTUN1418D_GA0071000_10213 [Candidatus Kentron sp. TUN]VFK55128.1 MAG: hypothetical protein BECKTUN1418E_GA0071001_10254 [Candidatus Kentron sp. TUN]
MNNISRSGILKGIGELALIAVFATLTTGCGGDEPAELSDAEKKATEERIAPVGKLRTQE